jgi:hypothetical protein
MSVIEEVNKIGCWEWQVQSFDGHRLCLVGGSDLVYCHVAELWVLGVTYLSCPTRLLHPVFRETTVAERGALGRIVDLSASRLILAIDSETTASLDPSPFLVAGESLELVRGTVYYYDRPDLKPGERLASWVKKAES